jgi:predicted lipid carrier protein YhbT
MVDTIEGFFQQLMDQQPQPLLSKVRGAVRFHLLDPQLGDDHWLVAIDHGDVSVSHAEGSADCAIRADKAFFERLVQGRENAIAAMLRGAIVCSGDVELLLAIQRIFPGPPKRQATGQRGARNDR